MKATRRLFSTVVLALSLAACTSSYYMPNVIQLSPSGTAAKPAIKSTASSFTLIALEDGYTGMFTAETTAGTCWVVQTPVTTTGAWTVVPQGSTCAVRQTDKIEVKDTNGHSASTYIRSL
jgi:hypothetical protein